MTHTSQPDSSDSSSDSDTQENSKKNASQVHVRGTGVVSRVRKLTQNFTQKISLDCNRYGKAWDDLSKLLESYIGYLTRTRIPIIHRDWRKVPLELKKSIYESVAQAFDPVTERLVLLSAGDKFRDFRKVLTREAKAHSKEPPSQYDFIDQATWDQFLRQRCTKDFQELSAKNRDNAKKIKYPYRLSRKGYQRKAREMLIERGEDPATSEIPRDELWLAARTTGSGKIDPIVEPVVSKLDELKQQVSQGLLKPSKKHDLLALALDKDDHSGRVIAVGFGVTQTDFFGENKRRRLGACVKDVVVLQNQVTNLEATVEMLRKVIIDLQSGQVSQGDQNDISRQGSCSLRASTSLSEPDKGEWKKCQLYWPSLTTMVAKGRAFIPAVGSYTLLHGRGLDSTLQLKINVDTVLHGYEDVELPISNGDEDCTCIQDAVGGFIAWPVNLVICVEADTSKGTKISANISKNDKNSDKNRCLENANSKESQVTSRISSLLMTTNKLDVKIDVPTNFLHYEHFLHFGNRELSIWLKGEELEAMHIAIYMRCLHENDKSNKYSFLCPHRLAWPIGNDNQLKERAKYMARSMLNDDFRGRLWFAPYNGGLHWMLGVIDPFQSIVYWLDPLGQDVRRDFKEVAVKALNKFNKKVIETKRAIRWINIECPKQLNNHQCGYYICRYMREIMAAGTIKIPEKYFEGSPMTYGDEHIRDIHIQWLKFVEPLLNDEINQI